MKTKILMLLVASLSLSSCNAQENEGKKSAMNSEKSEVVRPKGSWKVNRQFDENGNLTSYDSTYTYSYSTMNGDTIASGEMDAMMENFRRQFASHQMNSNPGFSFFFNDSINGDNNFFNEDFFRNGFPEDIQKQMEQMDSLQKQFLNQHYQPLIPREEEEKSTKKEGNKI